MLTNQMYDRLKWLAQIALPALGALYFGFAQIWGLPKGEEVVGSIVVVDAFLGTLLQVSNTRYKNDPNQYAGYLNSNSVDPDTGIPDLELTVTKMPDEILEGEEARLKIGPPPRPRTPRRPE